MCIRDRAGAAGRRGGHAAAQACARRKGVRFSRQQRAVSSLSLIHIFLQQIDGNIIGPKILGNSTGINGFWIMFAILLGGGLFGFIGMLLGVPVFVVIYAGLERLVDHGLKKRGLQTETAEYMDLDYIDDATMQPVRLPEEAPPESLKDTQDDSVK